MPTSEEALIESDNADFADDEARQLVESVDADYLVLISTRPATIDNLPIADQLTADRAQQFGSALHELGHIRYTAIANAAALLEERVDEAHQEFVHGLWNACEDAAIENQLRLDQSQIAADRIELVRRSISTHAEEYQTGESCAFTFRDAIETALYDEGIYDTGVRDALCDPDDDRIVFAGDADRQAYEQVADSISELVATILSTPNSVERIEHILDWWESVVKPLLDPPQQNQQESSQPDPDGATGESNADASSSDSSSSSADGETEKPTDGSADADRSSVEGEAGQTGESAPDNNRSGDDPDSSRPDEGITPDEMGGAGESEESSNSQAGDQPDPDAINTDQRQSHPGADVLDYPDIGSNEDADALRQPGHDGRDKDEAGSNGDSEVERESADDHQATGGDRENESAADTAGDAGSEDDGRENADVVGGSDTDTSPDEGGDTDATPDSGTDAGNSEETPGSDDGQSSQNDGSGANHSETTDVAGESDEQGSEGESERQTSESQSRSQSSGNPWGPSNDTNQASLGSFSTSESQTESGASASDSGGSDESPANESDAERDGSPTDVGDANESKPESESESESESNESDTVGDSGNDTTDGGDESSINEGSNTGSGNDSESVGDEGPAESSSIEDKDGVTTSESDTPASDGDTEREDTSTETTPDANKRSPASTPDHADRDDSLDREGALETDRDAAHDEAERATPDERGLERDLENVADALDALDEQKGGGAAPGSLSELDIMPDMEESSTKTTAERWGDAAADAEFVGGSLRKALKESHRDAHRSGVTSGTFDRRRTAALARGDVDVFQVRQPGDDKQYDLVIILDRSNSMRKHIKTAEDALVRFALACEEIGINVGVIDFINTEARLIKPFSVGSEHVRESLLSEQYGGKTPLADALGLSRELLEQRRNSPLVLVVTDGKPGSADAYQDELTQSYAPVCGVTLVLDQPSGSVPERVSRNERFYDRHVYVHESGQLADRLDQFAVMFSGL
ncbi:VWA domain-containing protein [Halococcus sp. PRR34]|uniref:VWA domain-containing protein n=1 Tax=Halococcus sp. PRR34 TaxID=3020830 RepID=UPI00235F046A|nr:VWA domain-containing protein [Halococcus sp. PRR34]